MGSPVSKMLCIAVLALTPACLGDEPDNSLGTTFGTSKTHSPVDTGGFDHPEVLPPKSRSREDAVSAAVNHTDYIEEIGDGGGYTIAPQHILSAADIATAQIGPTINSGDLVPTHILTAADIQPVVLLHHFDEFGVEHITRLDEKALRGE